MQTRLMCSLTKWNKGKKSNYNWVTKSPYLTNTQNYSGIKQLVHLWMFFPFVPDSQDGCDAYAPVGGRFAVPLYHKLEKSENLRWRHNKTKIFDQRPDRLVTGKQDDVFPNGSLKLTNLKRSSEGIYVPEVYDIKGKLVIDPRSLYLCLLGMCRLSVVLHFIYDWNCSLLHETSCYQ